MKLVRPVLTIAAITEHSATWGTDGGDIRQMVQPVTYPPAHFAPVLYCGISRRQFNVTLKLADFINSFALLLLFLANIHLPKFYTVYI